MLPLNLINRSNIVLQRLTNINVIYINFTKYLYTVLCVSNGMNSLHFVPFRLSVEDAKAALYKYHRKSFFNKHNVKFLEVKKAYLPFYACSATIDSYVIASIRGRPAQIKDGDEDDTTKVGHLIRHKWDGIRMGDKGMQSYASDNLQRRYIERLKGRIFQSMTPMSQRVPGRAGEEYGQYLSFSVSPEVAIQRYVLPFVETREERRVQLFLKHNYGSWRYLSHTVKRVWSDFKITPCYLPCFICEVQLSTTNNQQQQEQQEKFYNYVDGYEGSFISGPTIVHPSKLSLATSAATMTSSSLLFGLPSTWEHAFTWTTQFGLLPFATAFLLSSQIPLIRQLYNEHHDKYVHGIDSSAISDFDSTKDPVWWDFERTLKNFYSWQEREGTKYEAEKWAEYHQYLHEMGSSHTNKRSGPNHPDTLGYYAILGLRGREAVASSEEIQRAFKAKAHELHPDRQQNADLKLTHAKEFQHLSLAYSVLKDENKKRMYDLSGR